MVPAVDAIVCNLRSKNRQAVARIPIEFLDDISHVSDYGNVTQSFRQNVSAVFT